MRNLVVDDKWSIDYRDDKNDKPVYWRRYGELQSPFDENNAVVAMFYALLEKED